MLELRHERMNEVFEKFHVAGLPRGAVFHHFSAVDDFDPHDHPWQFRSIILSGGYVEEVFDLDGSSVIAHRQPGDSFLVPATRIHRIIELPEGECWTLILPEQWERKPGFYHFEDGKALHRFWDEAEFRPVAA